MIDLRSDTVMKVSPEMLKIMFEADVEHEGWNEDQNISVLETQFANITGKEAAVLLPTASTANILVTMAQTQKTDEVIAEYYSHIFQHAASSLPALANVQVHPVIASNHKYLTIEDIKGHVRTNNKYPITRLICLENTHTIYGGTITPLDILNEIFHFAHENKIKTHLDGARILYACAATNTTLADYCKLVDTVVICPTKGLGCPYGALLSGSKEVIQKVLYYKKVLGLSLHYVGYFATAISYALEHHLSYLIDDIKKAKYFTEKLEELHNIEIIPGSETNILQFKIKHKDCEIAIMELENYGIRMMNYSSDSIRAVIHHAISYENIDYAIEIISTL